LLCVLLAKIGFCWLNRVEQFRDDGCDAAKMAGDAVAPSSGRSFPRLRPRFETRADTSLRASASRLSPRLLLQADADRGPNRRIFGKVFVRSKLRGVDGRCLRGRSPHSALARRASEICPFVEITHRRTSPSFPVQKETASVILRAWKRSS